MSHFLEMEMYTTREISDGEKEISHVLELENLHENISHFLGSGKLHNMCNFRYVKEMPHVL